MTSHPCLPAPIRPNTIPSFQLVDASRQRLKDSPSPLVPSAWATLLQEYPGPLRVHLPMILRFGVQIGYEGPTDILRIEKNLTSANEDPETIENKLQEDLRKGRVSHLWPPPSAWSRNMTEDGDAFIICLIPIKHQSTTTFQKRHPNYNTPDSTTLFN